MRPARGEGGEKEEEKVVLQVQLSSTPANRYKVLVSPLAPFFKMLLRKIV